MKYSLCLLALTAFACGQTPAYQSSGTATLPTTETYYHYAPEPKVGCLSSVQPDHNLPEGKPPAWYFPFGHQLLFVGRNKEFGCELWRTDGTPDGTRVVKDVSPIDRSTRGPGFLTELNGLVYFMTESGPSKSPWEIWCTNGTEDGTKRVCSGERFKLHTGLIAFNGHLIFSGYEHLSERSLSPIRIYKLDGASGQISVLKDIPGTSSGIDYLFVHDRFLYFCTSINRQTTIWRTDGSTAGTIPIQQFSKTGYLPPKFFSWQGKTWFVGGSSENGVTLWQTDGSPEGTRPWIEVCSKSPAGSFSYVGDFFPFQNGLYWWENRYDQEHQMTTTTLWHVSGKSATAKKLQSFPGVQYAGNCSNFIQLNSTLYFLILNSKQQSGLWATDGSIAGTKCIRKLDVLSSELLLVGKWLYFSARQEKFTKMGCLWRSDGTAGGTAPDLEPGPQLGLPNPQSTNPRYLAYHNEAIWYTADNGLNRYEPLTPPLQIQFGKPFSAEHVAISGDAVHIQVEGGKGPYTIHWEDGSTGFSAAGWHDGIHSVTVTDSRGLLKTARFLYFRGDSSTVYPKNLRISREALPRFAAGCRLKAVWNSYSDESYTSIAAAQPLCYQQISESSQFDKNTTVSGWLSDSTRFEWFQVQQPQNQAWPASNGYLITPMAGREGEDTRFVLSAWKSLGRDSLELLGILPTVLHAPMGTVKIDTIIQLKPDHYLFLGTSAGGDGGLYISSQWVGVWRPPLDFKMLESMQVTGQVDKPEQEFVELTWDPVSQSVVFKRYLGTYKNNTLVNRKLLATKRLARAELLKE